MKIFGGSNCFISNLIYYFLSDKKESQEEKKAEFKSPLNSPLKKSDLKLIDPATLTKARNLSLDNMKINLKKTLKEKTSNLPITPTEPAEGFKQEDQEEGKDVAEIELHAIDETSVSENPKEILVDQKNQNPDSQGIDLKEQKHATDNTDIKITCPEKLTDQKVKGEKSSDSLKSSETKEDTPKKTEPITSTEKSKPVQKKEKRSSFSDLITFDQVPAMAKRTPSTESNKRERHNSASSADESKKKKREEMKSPKTKVSLQLNNWDFSSYAKQRI